MGLRVGQGRSKYNVPAPAVTGNPDFERAYRIQMNTLEWLPLFPGLVVAVCDRLGVRPDRRMRLLAWSGSSAASST